MTEKRFEFEHRLLRELHAIQAQRPSTPTRRRVVRRTTLLAASGVTLLATAGAVVALLLTTGPAAAAFNVVATGRGPVLVEIRRPLNEQDLVSLRRELLLVGGRETVTCSRAGQALVKIIKSHGRPVVVRPLTAACTAPAAKALARKPA